MFNSQQNSRSYTTIEGDLDDDDTVEIVLNSPHNIGAGQTMQMQDEHLPEQLSPLNGIFRLYHTLTFGFLNPLLEIGNKRPLEMVGRELY